MATPINITPVLKNEASAKFNQQLEAQKDQKVSQAEKERIFTLVDKILSNKNQARK